MAFRHAPGSSAGGGLHRQPDPDGRRLRWSAGGKPCPGPNPADPLSNPLPVPDHAPQDLPARIPEQEPKPVPEGIPDDEPGSVPKHPFGPQEPIEHEPI